MKLFSLILASTILMASNVAAAPNPAALAVCSFGLFYMPLSTSHIPFQSSANKVVRRKQMTFSSSDVASARRMSSARRVGNRGVIICLDSMFVNKEVK